MTVLSRHQVSAPNGVIVPSGGPLVGQEYFRIQDQDNRIWYWWISYDLAADWSHVPDNPHDQEVRFYLIPYWLKLVDAEGAVYYVSPALDGSPGVSQDPPAIGDGLTGAPALRVRGGKTRYRFDIVGGDIDVVST